MTGTRPYTSIFRRYLSIYSDCRADGIFAALGEIDRRSAMDDYPEIPAAACPAAIALERVLDRGSADLHWKLRSMPAAQLSRMFVASLLSGSTTVYDFEAFFANYL